LRHTGPEAPREGGPWPGVTSSRDGSGAGSPVVRRIASLRSNPGYEASPRRTWASSMQGKERQADSSRLGAGLTALPVVLYPCRCITPRRCSRDSGKKASCSRKRPPGAGSSRSLGTGRRAHAGVASHWARPAATRYRTEAAHTPRNAGVVRPRILMPSPGLTRKENAE
jgi:hypothetical protein